MPSLAAWKRRIKVGSRVLCVHNTYRPELNGRVRQVVKTQTIGFFWTHDDSDRRSHTDYPKAKDCTEVTDDEVEWKLFPGNPDKLHTVRLKIIA